MDGGYEPGDVSYGIVSLCFIWAGVFLVQNLLRMA